MRKLTKILSHIFDPQQPGLGGLALSFSLIIRSITKNDWYVLAYIVFLVFLYIIYKILKRGENHASPTKASRAPRDSSRFQRDKRQTTAPTKSYAYSNYIGQKSQRPYNNTPVTKKIRLTIGIALLLLPLIIAYNSYSKWVTSAVSQTKSKKLIAAKSNSTTTIKAKPIKSTYKPKPKFDAAVAMQSRVYVFDDPNFPQLRTDDYKKATGDLARIQYRMLRNKSRAKELPDVLIGSGEWSNEKCNIGPTLGAYMFSEECNKLIKISFYASGMYYEYPIEILTTLAHEWGHHVIHLSGENISGIANELLSDCFAGIYIAYLYKYNAITNKEFEDTIRMMGTIGNAEGAGVHGTPTQRRNGLVSGFSYMSDPSNPKTKYDWNKYCKGLDDVIDTTKGLP